MSGYDVVIVGFRLNASESPARALERVLGLPSDEAKRVAKQFPYMAANDVSADDAETLRAKLFEVGARSLVRLHEGETEVAEAANDNGAETVPTAADSMPPLIDLPTFDSSPPLIDLPMLASSAEDEEAASIDDGASIENVASVASAASVESAAYAESADQAEYSYGLGELNIIATATPAVVPTADEAWVALALATTGTGGGRLLDDGFEIKGSAAVELDDSALDPSALEQPALDASAAEPAGAAVTQPPARTTRRPLGGMLRREPERNATTVAANRWGLLIALPLFASGLASDDSLFLGNASALGLLRDICGLYAAFSGALGYSLRSVRVLSIALSALTALITWFAMPYVLAETSRAPVTKVEVPPGILRLDGDTMACSFQMFRAPKERLGLSSNALVLRTQEEGPFYLSLEGRFSDRELGWKDLTPDPTPLSERMIGLDWILNRGLDASYFQIVDERPAGVTQAFFAIDKVKGARKDSAPPIYTVEATFILQLGRRRTQELHYVGPMAVVDDQ